MEQKSATNGLRDWMECDDRVDISESVIFNDVGFQNGVCSNGISMHTYVDKFDQ